MVIHHRHHRHATAPPPPSQDMVIRPIKKYAPVRVTNPLSNLHMVYLHPNQGFMVEASEWMNIVDLECISEHFSLIRDFSDIKKSRYWEFELNKDLSDWSKCSNTYLGEVQLVTKDSTNVLCVMLLSDNSNVFTLINPESCAIKVNQHQIIECVFYNGDGQKGRFHKDRSVTSSPLGLTYFEQGEAILEKNSLNTQHMSAGFNLRPRNTQYAEYHYWYTLDQTTLQRIQPHFGVGVYHAGKISFGWHNPVLITVNLNIKNNEPKDKHKIICGNTWREPTISDVDITLKKSSYFYDDCTVIDLDELKDYLKSTNQNYDLNQQIFKR